MKKILFAILMAHMVWAGFAQQPSPFPNVDFSYAFGTPHRITVGRPTNGNRTLIDMEPGRLRFTWNYMDLTKLPLNTDANPDRNSLKRVADFTPEIDGKPFPDSKWTRMEGWLPSLENTYSSQQGMFHIEVVGGNTATIGKVEVVNTDQVEHEFRLECKMDWSINKGWIDWGRFSSDCLFCSYQDRTDRILLMGIGADQWTKNPTGQATSANTITFIWNLKPGEKKAGWIVQPYESYEANLPALRSCDWAVKMENAKQEWRNLVVGRADAVSVPDKNITTALKACFTDLFVMREPAPDGYVAEVCGTDIYRATNPVEPSIVAIALDQFGLHSEAADGLRIHLDAQGKDGDWADPAGWNMFMWWASGFKANAIMEHYNATGDKEYLSRVYPRMLASSRFQEQQRARSRVMNGDAKPLNYGFMPRGVGDSGLFDDGDGYGVFIPHNVWSVYADSLTLVAARILGKTSDVKELEHIFRTAKNDLLYTIKKGAIQEDGYRWIPGVAGKTCGSRYGALLSVYPCHLLPADDELITGTFQKMEKNMSKGGVPLHTGFMENGSWVAMVLDNVAEAYLSAGNGDKAAHYLYTTLNHGTPLLTWCEERGQEPGTHEISGDLQHLWTPVAVVRIIRDMLLMEDGDGLNLALGTDRSWLASGKPVGVTDMPSHFGDVTYQMQYDPVKKTVSGEIKLAPKPNQQACKWTTMHIRLPEGMKVASVASTLSGSATGASKATVLANGEGIRWEGPVTEVKFDVKVK